MSRKKLSAFAALRPLEGPGEARHYQGPTGIDAWVKRNRLSQKKFRPLRPLWPLEAAGGSWGGPTLLETTRDRCLGQKEPFEPKKNCGLWRPLEGPGGAGHHQGPPGIDAWVKRNRLSQKKISAFAAFVAIGGRWRVPGRPDTVRDHQGPPGIVILVKRNHLSKKKISAFAALRLLEGPGGAGHRQGPSGIDAWVKRNHLSQKKFRPSPTFSGLWRPPWRPPTFLPMIFEMDLT